MKKDYSEKSRKNMIGQMVEDDNLYSRSDMAECGRVKTLFIVTGVRECSQV